RMAISPGRRRGSMPACTRRRLPPSRASPWRRYRRAGSVLRSTIACDGRQPRPVGAGLVVARLRRDRGQQDLDLGISHTRMVAGPAVAVAALLDLLLVIALQPAEPLLALADCAAAF